jgi:hypothetical protein
MSCEEKHELSFIAQVTDNKNSPLGACSKSLCRGDGNSTHERKRVPDNDTETKMKSNRKVSMLLAHINDQ